MTNVFGEGGLPIAQRRTTSPKCTRSAAAKAKPSSRACRLTGRKKSPNNEVKAPPTYAGQKNRKASRAVACSAILTPRSSSPKKAKILMASPSEAQNAIAIQSQGFERTAIITCPFCRTHPRTECDSAFYVASTHCARGSAAGLAEGHLRGKQ